MTSIAATPTTGSAEPCGARSGCITCGDEGVAMRVMAVGADGLGRCEGTDGVTETVELTLVEPVGPGDEVLVHAGVALVRLRDGGRP